MARGKKTSKGKQKIEIKKIEAIEARQVCFSKRKFGIFSKANELSTLCGAKVAVLIESPAGHPFTFGSPSVEYVADLFLKGGSSITGTDAQEAQRLSGVQQLNNNLMEVGSKIEAAKVKKAALMSRITYLSAKNEDVRRMENVEDLNLLELEKLTETLERFKESIKTKMLKNMVTYSGNPSSTTQNLSGNGIGEAPSSVSAGAMTVFPEPELRIVIAGSSHSTDNKAMTMFPDPRLIGDNVGSSYGTGKGNPSYTMHNLSGNGIGEASSSVSAGAKTVFPELGPRVDNAGLSHGTGQVSAATMTVFQEPGLGVVDNTGSSYGTGKGFDIDMNLSIYEDESFDYMEQMNPFFDLNGNEAGLSEPRRFTDDDYKVHRPSPFELDLLGGGGNFTPKEDPK